MLTLTPDEMQPATRFVEEFERISPSGSVTAFTGLKRSHDFPDQRLVLHVTTEQAEYALKIDFNSPESGRLQHEFSVLENLSTQFATHRNSQVVRPTYMSPSNLFFVTEFIDRPTALDIICNGKDDNQVAQVYRRAGAWLQDLHDCEPAEPYAFWPQWMMERIRNSSDTLKSHARHDYQQMMNIMRSDAIHLRGQEDIRVFSHGDFHGLNLILGQGVAIGLDFTESRKKLAVYDIVDFLKADVFRAGSAEDLDRSGILKRNKAMFLRRYRHPINMDILDFCIRGRLLRDWLLLCQQDHSYSEFERYKEKRLRLRLKHTLTEPLL